MCIRDRSPRMWRPTKYGPDDFAAFRQAMDDSPVEAVAIHAVYLINCATKDKELRKKSLASLTHALRTGDGIGAAGVVLHPGAQKGEPLGPSMKRAAKLIAAAAAMSFAARFIEGPSGSPFCAPGWRTTPAAPIPSPVRSAWVSEASDFLRNSGSVEAQLIR